MSQSSSHSPDSNAPIPTAARRKTADSSSAKAPSVRVLCVDDHALLVEGLKAQFAIDDTLGNGFAIPTGSDEGWYKYTGEPNHWILALEDRVFIFRTAAERYAKLKFVSYYSNGQPPAQPLQTDSGYYTFKFVYQGNGSMGFE